MSEELIRVIIQLFSIVAKERLTDEERGNIKEFLAFHLNQETIPYYLNLFDRYCDEYRPEIVDIENADQETIEFVDDWARIVEIGKRINEGLTRPQKLVLVTKIIELVLADQEISERQSNLLFYIGEIIKISQKEIRRIERFVRAEDMESFDSKNILVIDDGSGEHPYKSHRIAAKNLTGLIAILRIPDTETYFIKYLGISDVVLNGVQLKSRKIGIFPTGSTIRGNKIPTIYFSDIISRFRSEEAPIKISFQADGIGYKFKSGDVGLKNINISEEGGKLIGIMGASGSGKSTLLSILNGSEKPTKGKVLINGRDIHTQDAQIEGVIGYVPQDDFLIEELTVYQNLFYAAKLCFGRDSNATIHDLVIRKLKVLGLMETKNLKVGSPLAKTISGGQRKRLNIGLELLREPSVLYVDEPTSGLSSRDSENIMDLLKELTLSGKMIFVVIHQPSSDIYKMFDRMIILDVGGYQIFYGNPLEALVYFKTIVNMVNKDMSACIECGNVNAEQIFSIIEGKVVNEFGRFTNQRKISARQWHKYFKEKITVTVVDSFKEAIKSTLDIPSRIKQWQIFSARDVLSKLGNRQYLIITLLEAPLLALFLSYLIRYYVSLEDTATGEYVFRENANIPIYFFMSIIVAIFMGLTVSAEEILRDRKILKREAFLHLSRMSYLSGKIAILFAISAIQTITFVLIGNGILEIKEMHGSLWLILFSCSCFANLVGLNISSAFKSAVTIYILIPLLVIPQLVLSGVVVNFDKFNPSISSTDKVPWFGELMASRWAFESAVVDQFIDNRHNRMFYEIDKQHNQSNFKRIYYLPELESTLSTVVSHLDEKENDEARGQLRTSLDLLRNELGHELSKIGRDKFPAFDSLTVDLFSKSTAKQARSFLGALDNFYRSKATQAIQRKNEMIDSLNATAQLRKQYRELLDNYHSDEIDRMVKNENAVVRVKKTNNEFVQKIYPIYSEVRPDSPWDFRANFYTPVKHIFGQYLDTFWFNVIMIWVMTVTLFVTLYFDLLARLIRQFEKPKFSTGRFYLPKVTTR